MLTDNLDELNDRTPEFALPENARDKNQRKRDHPEYDPTTLYLPPGFLNGLTPTMRQYWEIKS